MNSEAGSYGPPTRPTAGTPSPNSPTPAVDIVRLAAPTHLRAVRAVVLDSLGATDQKALTRIAEKLRIVPDDFG